MKKKGYESEGAKEYREANRRVQKAVKKAKEDWIGAQCEEIETCLNKNNSKRAYQLVKDLTSEKQGRSSTIQEKSGKCLTEEKEILSRWTEYCSEPHLGMFVTTGCSSRRQFVATASRQDTGSRQQNTDSGRQVTASGQFYKPSQTQESKYSSYALLLLCRLEWSNGSTFNERNFM